MSSHHQTLAPVLDFCVFCVSFSLHVGYGCNGWIETATVDIEGASELFVLGHPLAHSTRQQVTFGQVGPATDEA